MESAYHWAWVCKFFPVLEVTNMCLCEHSCTCYMHMHVHVFMFFHAYKRMSIARAPCRLAVYFRVG